MCLTLLSAEIPSHPNTSGHRASTEFHDTYIEPATSKPIQSTTKSPIANTVLIVIRGPDCNTWSWLEYVVLIGIRGPDWNTWSWLKWSKCTGACLTDLEGELSAVVVHSATVHQTEGVAHRLRIQHRLSGDGTDAAVGQRAGYHCRRLTGHLQRAHLKTVRHVCQHDGAFVNRAARLSTENVSVKTAHLSTETKSASVCEHLNVGVIDSSQKISTQCGCGIVLWCLWKRGRMDI